MNTYDFDIIYKKGSEMRGNYSSRNLVNSVWLDALQLTQAQSVDPLLQALKLFLFNKELLHNAKCHSLIKLFANDCFINDIIRCHILYFQPFLLPFTKTHFLLTKPANQILALSSRMECLSTESSMVNLMDCHKIYAIHLCKEHGVLKKDLNSTGLGAWQRTV